ncbi:hypothetical protein Q8F55_005496 [Vanrija albida]|uniref:Uncharacterized protein n=1 Tax=Vanrija albida TaxID=181172 RepID=A0ABR3Q1T4_9TREE
MGHRHSKPAAAVDDDTSLLLPMPPKRPISDTLAYDAWLGKASARTLRYRRAMRESIFPPRAAAPPIRWQLIGPQNRVPDAAVPIGLKGDPSGGPGTVLYAARTWAGSGLRIGHVTPLHNPGRGDKWEDKWFEDALHNARHAEVLCAPRGAVEWVEVSKGWRGKPKIPHLRPVAAGLERDGKVIVFARLHYQLGTVLGQWIVGTRRAHFWINQSIWTATKFEVLVFSPQPYPRLAERARSPSPSPSPSPTLVSPGPSRPLSPSDPTEPLLPKDESHPPYLHAFRWRPKNDEVQFHFAGGRDSVRM